MAEKPTTKDVGDNIQQQMDAEEVLTPNFGNWEVKDDGSMLYHGTEIPRSQILVSELETLHLTQMLSKFRGSKSDDAAQYYFAYLQALRNAGYKSVTIDLTHIHNIKLEK